MSVRKRVDLGRTSLGNRVVLFLKVLIAKYMRQRKYQCLFQLTGGIGIRTL